MKRTISDMSCYWGWGAQPALYSAFTACCHNEVRVEFMENVTDGNSCRATVILLNNIALQNKHQYDVNDTLK